MIEKNPLEEEIHYVLQRCQELAIALNLTFNHGESIPQNQDLPTILNNLQGRLPPEFIPAVTFISSICGMIRDNLPVAQSNLVTCVFHLNIPPIASVLPPSLQPIPPTLLSQGHLQGHMSAMPYHHPMHYSYVPAPPFQYPSHTYPLQYSQFQHPMMHPPHMFGHQHNPNHIVSNQPHVKNNAEFVGKEMDRKEIKIKEAERIELERNELERKEENNPISVENTSTISIEESSEVIPITEDHKSVKLIKEENIPYPRNPCIDEATEIPTCGKNELHEIKLESEQKHIENGSNPSLETTDEFLSSHAAILSITSPEEVSETCEINFFSGQTLDVSKEEKKPILDAVEEKKNNDEHANMATTALKSLLKIPSQLCVPILDLDKKFDEHALQKVGQDNCCALAFENDLVVFRGESSNVQKVKQTLDEFVSEKPREKTKQLEGQTNKNPKAKVQSVQEIHQHIDQIEKCSDIESLKELVSSSVYGFDVQSRKKLFYLEMDQVKKILKIFHERRSLIKNNSGWVHRTCNNMKKMTGSTKKNKNGKTKRNPNVGGSSNKNEKIMTNGNITVSTMEEETRFTKEYLSGIPDLEIVGQENFWKQQNTKTTFDPQVEMFNSDQKQLLEGFPSSQTVLRGSPFPSWGISNDWSYFPKPA